MKCNEHVKNDLFSKKGKFVYNRQFTLAGIVKLPIDKTLNFDNFIPFVSIMFSKCSQLSCIRPMFTFYCPPITTTLLQSK